MRSVLRQLENSRSSIAISPLAVCANWKTMAFSECRFRAAFAAVNELRGKRTVVKADLISFGLSTSLKAGGGKGLGFVTSVLFHGNGIVRTLPTRTRARFPPESTNSMEKSGDVPGVVAPGGLGLRELPNLWVTRNDKTSKDET